MKPAARRRHGRASPGDDVAAAGGSCDRVKRRSIAADAPGGFWPETCAGVWLAPWSGQEQPLPVNQESRSRGQAARFQKESPPSPQAVRAEIPRGAARRRRASEPERLAARAAEPAEPGPSACLRAAPARDPSCSRRGRPTGESPVINTTRVHRFRRTVDCLRLPGAGRRLRWQRPLRCTGVCACAGSGAARQWRSAGKVSWDGCG